MEDITSNTQVHANTLRLLLGLLILFAFCTAYGQKALSTSNKKSLKLYEKADKKYKERDFESALSFLEQSVDEDPLFFEAYVRMGSLYNALGQMDSVYSKFGTYLDIAQDPIASVVEKMAFMAFDRGHYDRSYSYLERFLAKVPERREARDIMLLAESLKFSFEQLKNPINISIEELPAAINQFKLQYLPAITVDGLTMIYTKRDVFSSDEDIVVSHKQNGEWKPSVSISNRINTPLNEGACSISADGRIMIFTSCDRRDTYGSCDLYIARKVGDNWSKPENLGKSVNSQYWESQPSLSADGKTLYFASNRPGGYGGRDLWVVTSDNKGEWQRPVNLGSAINSFKDETTPFIHSNGTTLYFSSNSYPGMGGFDLFEVHKRDSTWSEIANLGYPINTFRDEVSFLVTSDGKNAFFAKEDQKNREILDSRIVGFELPDLLQPLPASYIVGKVVDANTKVPLTAKVEVVDIDTNVKLYQSSSDSITGEYYMILPSGRDLAGYVKKRGYMYTNFHFTTHGNQQQQDTLYIELERIQVGQSLVLKNIYFELDSYEVDQRSMSEIESVIQLMTDNPTLQIEINGHTDDIGDKGYNQKLSEKRALSVYDHVVNGGIKKERLHYQGFGDTKPLNPNNSEDNRKSNRRIEFRVLDLK